MKFNVLFRYALILLVISVNIGCDQISKSVVRKNIKYQESIQLVNDNVVLTKVENSGAFLSMGDSLSPVMKNLLLLGLPVVTLLFGLFLLFRHSGGIGRWSLIAWCSIMGGGIGNIFDRVVHGSVTDFLYIHWGFFRTGIFNMADVSITGGILAVLVLQLLESRKT